MAAPAPQLRRSLSAPGLIRSIRTAFESIPDRRRAASTRFSLPDTLLAAQAMFQFKHASMLKFDRAARDPNDDTLRGNLETLFAIDEVACDTQMRRILDPVDPAALRPAFRAVHSSVQRGGALKDFGVFDGRLLVSIDGTGQFGSTTVRCEHCCTVASKKKGVETEYRHQLLTAAIVHPDRTAALPVDFEPIVRGDGAKKNDCELCAARRLVDSLAAQFPTRSMIVVEDALYANGPHVKQLQDKGFGFIIVVKPTGSESLFADFDALKLDDPARVVEHEELTDEPTGACRGYRFANDLALNHSHVDVRVNLLEFWEVDKQGRRAQLELGDEPCDHAGQRLRDRARRTGPVADRERRVQHAQEPGLRVRAQLRARREVSCEHARRTDAAGLPGRPGPAAQLPLVPGGAGEGRHEEGSVGGDAGDAQERGARWLGDAVAVDREEGHRTANRKPAEYRLTQEARRESGPTKPLDEFHPTRLPTQKTRPETAGGEACPGRRDSGGTRITFTHGEPLHAVPYELPTDGYYQLQDATTFRTLCETGRGACDVAPGRYVLIDFRVQPARRSNVTVTAGGGGTGGLAPSSFVNVDRQCAFGAGGEVLTGGILSPGSFDDGVASCSLSCPASAPRLYGVLSCDGVVRQGRDVLDVLGTSFLSARNSNAEEGVTCSTDGTTPFIQPSPVSRNGLIVRAMCGPR